MVTPTADEARRLATRYVRDLDLDAFYFDVIERTDFTITIQSVKDITKLSDNFLTREQLDELMPISSHYTRKGQLCCYVGAAIRPVMDEWVDLVDEDSASTQKMTPRTKNLYQSVDAHTINLFTPNGYECNGGRMYHRARHQQQLIDRAEAKAQRQRIARIEAAKAPYVRPDTIRGDDYWNLERALEVLVRREFGMRCDRIYTDSKPRSVYITALKKLVRWPDVNQYLRANHTKKRITQDIVFIKQIWNDPSLADGVHI